MSRKRGSLAGQLFEECRKDLRLCSKGYSRASASRHSTSGGGLKKSLVECSVALFRPRPQWVRTFRAEGARLGHVRDYCNGTFAARSARASSGTGRVVKDRLNKNAGISAVKSGDFWLASSFEGSLRYMKFNFKSPDCIMQLGI